MLTNTDTLIPMAEANQNFSRVVRAVDEKGIAVILKNNKPKYVVVSFDEYDEIQVAREERQKKMDAIAERLIKKNHEAFEVLAK
ncbi:MAG TPA: type II toxin-antitoxin system Phd/YefM family antitoxin [Anaerovoracaceae bacterium]|nr:type II toxin-antitoxin system Phd/YefM family antitoxin [Anaerovoracaceae bacterium]